MTHQRGFTLVEVLIVTVILAIIAAVVMPMFGQTMDTTRRGTFVTDLQTFARQAEIFRAKTGQYLPDGGSGVLPIGFEDYIDAEDWENGTPVGGVWDSEHNSSGVTFAIGVHFDGTGDTRDDAFMTFVDEIFDDGDVNAGKFRKLGADRYYYVMTE